MTPTEARNRISEIRPIVSSGKSKLLEKFKLRIAAVENLKAVGVLAGVVGALIAAVSRGVEGSFGLGLAIGGAVLAAVSAAFIGLMDRKKLDISQEASDAHLHADEALDLATSLADHLESTQTSVEEFDTKRRERLVAIQRMIEVMEASLVTRSRDVDRTAQALLRTAIHSIRAAVEYQGGDFFTVTIFRKVQDGDTPVMQRIAAEWTDPDLASRGGRSWRLGRGYTGVAWQNAETNPNGDVVIGDTEGDEVRVQYPVDEFDSEREQLYRSVAAIPILINRGNAVWGVVTATTNRPNVFVRDRQNIKVQNVEMVRDVARVAALLAGLEKPAKSCQLT